ncbi:hypothetical protein PRIC1_000653 [Phytophthora ramorum]
MLPRWLLLLVWGAVFSGCTSTADVYSQEALVGGSPLEPSADSACEVDEIQLASDGTIAQWGLALGTRVAPNMTHLITVELLCNDDDVSEGGDANLYLSSEVKYPRMGHSSWIAQRPGNELIKLYTYLDGFPRKDEEGGSRWIALHIGVYGPRAIATRYDLTVSVTDLPITRDILAREEFYTEQHKQARKPWLRQG